MPADAELVIALLVAVVVLTRLASALRLPYPIVLVVGGLALGFVPALPEIQLSPDLVLVVFLPPLLFSAAWNTSWREFRADVPAIGLLAIGLVLATTILVAVVAHAVISDLGWAAAFVLGAVVSPTDPVAAVAVFDRLGVPRRVTTIVEGESLVNDAVGLVLYTFAVSALTAGTFSAGSAALEFAVVGVGSIAIGVAVGWASTRLRGRVDDAPIEITLSLLTAFGAYLLADALGWSGVLATVTAGLFASRRQAGATGAATRLEASAVWNTVVFVLNGLLFVVIGLELRPLLDGLAGTPALELLVDAGAVCATVVVVRVAWVLVGTAITRLTGRDGFIGWRNATVISWSGLRGAISLAAALAIPLSLGDGTPNARRDLIIFVAYAVVIVTLVGQGISLPAVIRALGVEDDQLEEEEERLGRIAVAQSALARLDELAGEDWVDSGEIDRFRQRYTRVLETSNDDDATHDARSRHRLHREILAVERRTLLDLREQGGDQ